MRILALTTDAYGAGGGIAQYNRDLFQALAASGAVGEVVILTRNGQTASQVLPTGVSQLNAQPGKIAYAIQALRVAHKPRSFDAIFCGHLYMAPLAALISKLTGAPVWLQLHGIEAWQRPSRLQRWAAEQAQLVTAVSRHTRRLFLAWANRSPETVKVLPNTVEERFSPGPRSQTLLERYNLHGKKVLLTVSRLAASEQYKGHDRVIHALAALNQNQSNKAPPPLVGEVGRGSPRSELGTETLPTPTRPMTGLHASPVPAGQSQAVGFACSASTPTSGEGAGCIAGDRIPIIHLPPKTNSSPTCGGGWEGEVEKGIVYLIAGDGDDRPRLQQLAHTLGVQEHVRFIGYIPDNELPDLYRTADVFIMPSTGEGFGIVFLQALASGIPVIGGDSDGSRDPLRDGLDGHLVKASDPTALTDAIDAVIHGIETPRTPSLSFSRQHFASLVRHLVEKG